MLERQQVQHVAHLARLALSEEEEVQLTSQLGDILAYVEQLSALDTSQVAPTLHALDLPAPLRADEQFTHPHREAILANAPDRAEDFYKVPRLLGGEDD